MKFKNKKEEIEKEEKNENAIEIIMGDNSNLTRWKIFCIIKVDSALCNLLFCFFLSQLWEKKGANYENF